MTMNPQYLFAGGHSCIADHPWLGISENQTTHPEPRGVVRAVVSGVVSTQPTNALPAILPSRRRGGASRRSSRSP